MTGGSSDTLLGLFEVTVDPGGGATLSPAERTVQSSPQALSYDVDIQQFLSFHSLAIHGTGLDGDGNLVLEFIHRHPFTAPNFDLPVSGTNRADLGYTGRLVVLANTEQRRFFDGSITLDPYLVKDPDGYLHTGDLLHTGAERNNTFPYVLLVDEARDNRVGISNNGAPSGNYDPGIGGWQRANIGGGRGWTGYDYLHAGQEAISRVTLDGARLDGKPLRFFVAVMAKYTDPRGVADRESRMPPVQPDVSRFAYRLPHAALDIAVAESCGGVIVPQAAGNPVELRVEVRDWDAYGATGSEDLASDPNVDRVRPGAAGLPQASFDCPAVLGTPVSLSAVGGTGLPGDELIYTGDLASLTGPATGEYWGVVRLVDPEDGQPAAGRRFGVDPVSLAPDPARALTVRTYLPIPVRVSKGSGWARLFGGEGYDAPTAVATDADGNIYLAGSYATEGADLDPGNCQDVRGSNGFEDAFLVKLDPHGRRLWAATWGGSQMDQATAVAVGPNGMVYVIGTIGGTVDMDPGSGTDTSSGPNNSGFLAQYDGQGTYRFHRRWGGPEPLRPVDVAVTGSGNVVVFGDFRGGGVDMDPGPGVVSFNASGSDLFLSHFDSEGTLTWATAWGGPVADFARAVAADDTHGVAAVGAFQEEADFDPGAAVEIRTSAGQTDAFMSIFGVDGLYRAAYTWGSDQTDQAMDVMIAPDGGLQVVGFFSQVVDFDPGAGVINLASEGATDGFASRFDPAGVFLGAQRWGGPDADSALAAALDANGDLAVVGSYRGNARFGIDSLSSKGGDQDPYLLKLDPAANVRWVRGWGSDLPDWAMGIAAGVDGAHVVAGIASGATDFDPGAGAEERIAHLANDAYLLRLDPEGQF